MPQSQETALVPTQLGQMPVTDAAAAKSEVNDILFAVSHHMKGNLRALSELPNWVEEDLKDNDIELPPDVKDHLDLLRNNACQLKNLLDGLIELSCAGRVPETPQYITVEKAARQAWVDLAPDPRFQLQTHKALDAICLPPKATTSVFKALLENTVHHHDRDAGRVCVTSVVVDHRVYIKVEDDGPGIPENARDSMFESLAQLRRREETGRAGLGLTLARKLVTRFGGNIALSDASKGRGIAVTFDLPVRALG